MDLTLTLPAIAYLIGVVLGSLIAFICWLYPKNVRSSIKLLGISIFSLTWILFIFFLSESYLIYYLPHLFHTSFIASLIYLPFSYFFVRSVTHQINLSYRDLAHALPLILFLIDYSVIYLLPAGEKLVISQTESGAEYIYQQGWFVPAYLHKPIRFLLFLFYTGLQFRLVLFRGKPVRKLLLSYLILQFMLIFYYVIYQFSFDPFIWRLINILISAYLVCVAIGLLLHPEILYSYGVSSAEMELLERLKKHEADDSPEKSEKKIKVILTDRLESYMKAEMPYLRHSYSIHDLSTALQIPTYQLSSFLNHDLGVSFNDYLNKYRILYSVEKIKQGAARSLTLEALAYDCGFNNRNSFTSAFKRFMRVTPSEFLRSQRLSIEPAKYS